MKKIKSLMTLNDLTQSQLAKYLSISRLSVNLKLNGIREFTQSELITMAELFKVTIDYLLEREN